MPAIRVLLLADTHLGLDFPERPRVERRRRGHDFLANHEAALAPAFRGEVDLVVHGGDVFDRPRISAPMAMRAYAPLLRAAERGVPVFVVPGNHERGRLPHARLLAHPNIHVFDRPRTFRHEVGGVPVSLSGFPYERGNVRARFLELLDESGWDAAPADVRLLCVHHCVEGATVGPGDYTFTRAPDVIRGRDLPAGFAAVLSGHIHRHQVLTGHLSGRPLAAPVFYPGSVERTSSAETGEAKGYLLLHVETGAEKRIRLEFRELYARPMLLRSVAAGERTGAELDRALRALVGSVPADAVLRVSVEGDVCEAHRRVLAAAHLRSYVPECMNVDVRLEGALRFRRRERATRGPAHQPLGENLPLGF